MSSARSLTSPRPMATLLGLATALCAVLFLCVAVQPAAAKPAKRSGHVYLFRGLANVFSLGMDELADKLEARGIEASVYNHTSWQSVADQAAAESRRNKGAPIILIGHSLGADAAIQAAERLTALGTPPRLVVTFDPVGVSTVGRARGRFINFFQSNNGYGKKLTAEKGFRGSISNRDLAANTDLGHFNLDKSPGLHAEVLRRVSSITRPRRAAARPRKLSPAPVPTARPEENAHASAGSGAAARQM
ncbi:thioesterase domain-containing protein [Xanthobacter sp. TB0139]|uniref:thioesterase domain-containing protein n=1 Tax=Xanthobacter sp. TB0139 TaxID=3459178 RepID=UPI00403A664A